MFNPNEELIFFRGKKITEVCLPEFLKSQPSYKRFNVKHGYPGLFPCRLVQFVRYFVNCDPSWTRRGEMSLQKKGLKLPR